jgi:hypothetical protein
MNLKKIGCLDMNKNEHAPERFVNIVTRSVQAGHFLTISVRLYAQ